MSTQVESLVSEVKVKKSKFFFESTLLVLKVDDMLYRIPKHHLVQSSQVFRDMFDLPQGPDSEGSTEENPIVLTGCTNEEFESLLEVLVGLPGSRAPGVSQSSKPQWIAVLKLATMWEMPELRQQAIDALLSWDRTGMLPGNRRLLTNIEMVKLGKAYRAPELFLLGCRSLIEGDGDIQRYSVDQLASEVGWETAAHIYTAAYSAVAATMTALSSTRSMPISDTGFLCELCKDSQGPGNLLVVLPSQDMDPMVCRNGPNCYRALNKATILARQPGRFYYNLTHSILCRSIDSTNLLKTLIPEVLQASQSEVD
ncbi:hypothetical protein D9611_008018 [Ephemerocybe angulata]|uniref:BTB domain-containing protein n=1 Tax=Ephemerocybe angulata TaxID=980116 RepID=A0A8H5FD90_9AGAR|nr:hypothetical protein D9611_008018 [Tulosesus angulatus]